MGFSGQVRALLRKDLRVALANRVGTTMEVLFPIFIGCIVGLFIKLVQLVQNIDLTTLDADSQFPSMAGPSTAMWMGIRNEQLTPMLVRLAAWLAPAATAWGTVVLQTNFSSTAALLTAAADAANHTASAANNYSGYVNVFAMEAVSDNNFSLYGGLVQGSDTGLVLPLGRALIEHQAMLPGSTGTAVQTTMQYGAAVILPNLRAIFSSTGMVFLLYAFVPALILTAGRLVEEKRCKVRETLKVMGAHDGAYVLSSYISSICRMSVGTGLVSVCLAAFSAIDAADIIPVFFIGLLFSLTLVAYAQLMPALFSNSTWSNVACIMLLAVGAGISAISTGWPLAAQALCCLLSPIAYFYAVLPYMARGTVLLEFSTGGAVAMLAVDWFIYFLLGNYIYQIAPGDFGVPKHPLFFLNLPALCGWGKKENEKQKSTVSATTAELDHSNPDSTHSGLQHAGGDTAPRVMLRGLFKYFGSQRDKPSVNNLSLSIDRGEIFALLGHNGAGKTTTISILTGMITPTDYAEASVDGVDIRDGMDTIRQNVALCPQFDVLFNDLSARQHLELFAEVKGIDPKGARVNALMHRLSLPDTPQKSSSFSGGMKRRLSVGNALVGDAELIFLDEPSSGMDPLSRREMWDLLKEERGRGKTIVLTTHFMEEADYLGDRIAIMARGQLFCCDTSAQLKGKHGVGYYLTLAKDDEKGNGNGNGNNGTAEMLRVVQQHIPLAAHHHESSGDATFLLPMAAIDAFPAMLRAVEQHHKHHGFSNFGVSMNSLEDVFVAISEQVESGKAAPGGGPGTASADTAATPVPAAGSATMPLPLVNGRTSESLFEASLAVTPAARLWSQTRSVFLRKALMLRRNRRMQLMVILFPLVFVVLALLVMQPKTANDDHTQTTNLPDYSDFHVVSVSLADDSGIMRAFTRLFADRYRGSQLTVYNVDSIGAFNSGEFLPLKSVSYVSGFHPPTIAAVFILNAVSTGGPAPTANYTLLANTNYDPLAYVEVGALFAAAVQQAVGGRTNVTVPRIDIRPMPDEQPGGGGRNGTHVPAAAIDPNDPKRTRYNVIQLGIYVVLAVVQLVANCAVPMADELNRQVYHVSRAQGQLPLAFFAGNFLFDLLCSLFPFVILFIGSLAKGVPAYHDLSVLLSVLLAGILFAVHVILQGYVLVSYVRDLKPVLYTGILHLSNLLMFGAPYLVDVILNAAGMAGLTSFKPFLLSLTPPASFYHIMDNASDLDYYTSRAGYILTLTGDVATGWGYLFLVFELAVPIVLLYLFATDRAHLITLRRRKTIAKAEKSQADQSEHAPLLANNNSNNNNQKSDASQDEDVDVAAERARVCEVPGSNAVYLQDLRKDYGGKAAVKGITLGIRHGDCFGLLGPNGAGKSTTCNMILRHTVPTSGNIAFPAAAVDVDTPTDAAFRAVRVGMCTQNDTLWEFLSAEEHMEQFLAMRLATTYCRADWQPYIRETIRRVHLAEAGAALAGGYSGGMKRKLLVCLAMYTGATIVFLDEPSTGMDPFSRRALWAVVLEALTEDRSVLLTTHSMEEADAVCGRITIITDGQLRCIGSSQHLKGRFGSGYVLTILHQPGANPAAIDAAVANAFPSSGGGVGGVAPGVPAEVLGFQRRYDIGRLDSLAAAFEAVQQRQAALGIAQYSISQTASLEQIFLKFVGNTANKDDTEPTKKQ